MVGNVPLPETFRQTTASAAGARSGTRSTIALRLLRLWYAGPPTVGQTAFLTTFSFTAAIYRRLLLQQMRRAQRNQAHLPAYVVSIGNLVAGGTGKTPFAIWLAQFYRHMGTRVAILSRGYGGTSRSGLQVPVAAGTSPAALEFGDEPALMAQTMPDIPVWTGRRRSLSGLAAIEQGGAELLVLDDGFQHLALHRDLDIVLLDSANPFGNGRLIPIGPLREPFDHLQRADVILLTRADDPAKTAATFDFIRRRFPGKAVFRCRHHLSGFNWGITGPSVSLDALRRRKLVAFAGIAHPESFFASLTDLQLHLAAQTAFPDHCTYQPTDLVELLALCSRLGADLLITTEKDAVRLPPDFRRLVVTAHLELDFGADLQPLKHYLVEHLRLSAGAVHPPNSGGNVSSRSTPAAP